MASPDEIQEAIDDALRRYGVSGDPDALFAELEDVIVPEDDFEWTSDRPLSEVRKQFLLNCPQEAQSKFVNALFFFGR